MRARELTGGILLIAVTVAGCAQVKAIFAPSAPPSPPVKKESVEPSPSAPAPPPPVTDLPTPPPPPIPAPPPVKEEVPPPPTKKESVEPSPRTPAPRPPVTKAPTPPPPPIPPAPPPVKEEVPPPTVLSPQVGRADEERLKREFTTRVEKTQEIIARINEKKLSKEQQDILSTILSFLVNAKEALVAQDFLRAFNLADKAQILTEDLFRNLQ